MAERVAISKAALMLGIKRGELQQLIHDGALATFEGQVDMEELKQRFPRLAFCGPSTEERVQRIRAGAFARRVSQVVAPDRDSLENQLRKRSAELSVQRARAEAYYCLIDELLRHLTDMRHEGEAQHQQLVEELNQWILKRLPE